MKKKKTKRNKIKSLNCQADCKLVYYNFSFITFLVWWLGFYFIFIQTRYFPKEATQEVLDEIFPKLFPLDTGKICGAFDLLSIFLNPLQGYELWLTDFINLWNTYHNPSWNVVRKIFFLCFLFECVCDFDIKKMVFHSNVFLLSRT